MSRAALLLLLSFAGVTLLPSPARADDASTGPTLNPAEATCVGQNPGSPCNSSTTTAGGTCKSGCCTRLVNGPDQPPVAASCLACSDTSNVDPDFKDTPCSDGGSAANDAGFVAGIDAGTVIFFDGGSTPSPVPSGGGCSSAALGERAPAPIAGGLLLGAALVTLRRRRRR